jgi:HK97 family phage major capsid protein/HK97 family phage prohead protease
MATYKGEEINTKPNEAMAENARKGLEWREEYGRGGTEVGVARARDLSNRRELSIDTVRRMYSYFARHEVDKQAEGFFQGEDGFPSAGRIAYELWGGEESKSWTGRIVERLDSLDDRSEEMYESRPYPNEHAARIQNPEKYQGFRRMNDELGDGIHIVLGLLDGQSELQSIRFDKTKWSVDEAQQWLAENDYSVLKFEPAIEEKAMEDQQVDIEEVVEAVVEEAVEVTPEPIEEDRKGSVEISHRAMDMDDSAINEETRTVRMSISSEYPVQRSFGMEILEHSADAIDLSFLNSGRAPLLLDHDPEKQIGVIESVELDSSARRLRATARFGKGTLAREAFDDVVDGIKSNISIGYAINKLERKDKDTYVAKSWRVMEASLVALPADQSTLVGVGRSCESSPKPVIKTDFKENPMSEQTFDIAAVEAEARKAAQRNAAQIVELGARHNKSDLARKAIAEGQSIEEFRGELLEAVGSTRALEEKEIGMSQKEVKKFSLMRAIHALANPTDRRAQEAAAFEFECSRAAAEAYGRTAQGILLPAEVMRNWKRDLNSSDDSALFTDDFRGGDFIDALRNASSVMQAGARMLSGLSGDVKIPKKTTAASAAWIASEGGAASESEMTVGSVTMTPKSIGSFTDISRQLMIQSSLDVEALVRDDLAQAIALAIDLGALAGSGSSGQPTGIKNTGGINVVDFGTAPDLIPTWAQVVEMETKVREDNALGNGGAYIANATMYGALKAVEKAANTAQFVVGADGNMNGYNTIVSNQVASGDLYFGDFQNNLLIGFFGGLDIVVDPYTASTTGTVRVVALQSCDVAVRHAAAFCLGNDGGS